MTMRKYPMNHAEGLDPESTETLVVDCSFIDDFKKQVKEFTDCIDAWVEKNRPKPELKQAHSKEEPCADQTVHSGANSCEDLEEIIDSILYGGPEFEDDNISPNLGNGKEMAQKKIAQKKHLAKRPLYAGPEDLVFGNDPVLTPDKRK